MLSSEAGFLGLLIFDLPFKLDLYFGDTNYATLIWGMIHKNPHTVKMNCTSGEDENKCLEKEKLASPENNPNAECRIRSALEPSKLYT